MPKSTSDSRTGSALPEFSTGEGLDIGRAVLPSSPGSQMQPGAPHSHQLPVKVCPASAIVANGAELVSLSPIEDENHIGSTSMHTTATSNLVLTVLFSFKRLAELEKRVSQAGLYQGIARTFIRDFHTERALTGLATKLASVGDDVYSISQADIVGDVGAGVASIKKDGMLIGEVVIPYAHDALLKSLTVDRRSYSAFLSGALRFLLRNQGKLIVQCQLQR